MKVSSEVFVDFKKWLPYPNLPIIANTKYGIRRVVKFDGCYWYIDCTHPAQNAYCSIFDIISWRYKDDKYMENLSFIENKYERRKEGEEILAKIKLTLIERIIFYIKTKIANW